MKRMLAELEREHPGVKASLLKSLGNVHARHLLDRRLNPVAEPADGAADAVDRDEPSGDAVEIERAGSRAREGRTIIPLTPAQVRGSASARGGAAAE